MKNIKSKANACIIGHYNPLEEDYDLVSHTNYVVCFNFMYEWRDLQSILNDRFLRKFFKAIFYLLL